MSEGLSGQMSASGGVAEEATCASCGESLTPPGRTRRVARTESGLCLSCDRRVRRSAYFRVYYEAHRDRILDKNRRWARENRERLVHLRRARQLRKTRDADEPRRCLDCGEVVVRALRCRRCYTRFRYATDPAYRQRRLATTRRWLERRRATQDGTPSGAPPAQPLGAAPGRRGGAGAGREGLPGHPLRVVRARGPDACPRRGQGSAPRRAAGGRARADVPGAAGGRAPAGIMGSRTITPARRGRCASASIPASRPTPSGRWSSACAPPSRALHELGFDVIEISLTERMFELGLRTVFGGELLDLMQGARQRFHLHLFPLAAPDGRQADPGISNPSPYPRSIQLRRLTQVVEFFEASHPMQLYLIHAGWRTAAFETHLRSLRRSLDALDTLYPGVPLALTNDRPGGVLSQPNDFLELLEASPNLRFVFNTGLAYHAVDYNAEAYAWLLRSLARFEERLAEIQWSNGAPGEGLNRPLHVNLERGLDIHRTIRTIGRNPAIVHLFGTVGGHVPALARERRAVYNSARL